MTTKRFSKDFKTKEEWQDWEAEQEANQPKCYFDMERLNDLVSKGLM